MEVVKKIVSPSKQFKAEIIKRNDGIFHIEIYIWNEEYEFWSLTTRNLSLIDTKEHAINIAIEELRNRTGEDIIL